MSSQTDLKESGDQGDQNADDNSHPLEMVLQKTIEDSEGKDVTLRDILRIFGSRSFGPVFTILGLFAGLPPMGAIPGIPAAVGVVILLFSLQVVFGRSHIWTPSFIGELSVERSKLKKAYDKAGTVLRMVDGLVTERLTWATGGAMDYVAAIVVSVLALSLIPLEVVPFAVGIPAAAITLIGLAVLARDGLLMLIALSLTLVSFYVMITMTPVTDWLFG